MKPEGKESWEQHPGGPPKTQDAPKDQPPQPNPASQSTPQSAERLQNTAPAAPPKPAQAAPKPKIVFDTYQGTVTRMETHHSGLWEFDFRLDKPMAFTAGQYVSVCFPGMKPAPFSIASSPVDKNGIVLGVEIVGEVTTKLSQLKPGDVAPLKGPFGNFVIKPEERKVCFLAGGIGITPFMSMLRWIRDTHPDKHAVLFYSCKTRDQFMWLDELREMQEKSEHIKIVLTLTKEQLPDWNGRTGRFSEEMIREELPDFKEYVYFTCGPPGLIEAVFALMEGMGVPKEHIRREAWH